MLQWVINCLFLKRMEGGWDGGSNKVDGPQGKLTLKTKLINITTIFGRPYLKEYQSFCQTVNWDKCATKLAIIHPYFSLSIMNEVRSIESILELLLLLTFNCKNKFTSLLRVLPLTYG